MNSDVIAQIKSAPKEPGVYIFYKGSTPLYVGKASSLKNRLQSYLKITDFKTKSLHEEADELKLLKLHSNIEALIVESRLIKDLKPRYNILWRDDKNYFYVAVSKEIFPRIFLTHQLNQGSCEYIGPFTDGQSLKAILRLLRKQFPYCTCREPHRRICLNAQINYCLGFCCNKNLLPAKSQIRQYRKNIRKIENILSGKDKKFIRSLKDPYELLILEKIWAHQPYLAENSRLQKPEAKNKIPDAASGFEDLVFGWKSAECYDNSHLSGKEAVGALTAWKKTYGEWRPDKNFWRKFRILGRYTEDDPRMMEEVVRRRLNHPEWPYPDLLIIDGGLTQLNAAKRALRNSAHSGLPVSKIKIVSFAKPQRLVFGLENRPVALAGLPAELQKLIGLAIQNTHNFVRRYHRQVRQKQLLKI